MTALYEEARGQAAMLEASGQNLGAAKVIRELLAECTCPTGDGSLRWPCPEHPLEDGDGKH